MLCLGGLVVFASVWLSLGDPPGAETSTMPQTTQEGPTSGDVTLADGSTVPAGYEGKMAVLEKVTTEQGGFAGLSLLDDWMGADEVVQTRCHNLAHIVGRTAARFEDPSDLVPLAPASRCDGGFMHGILQTYAMTSDEIEILDIGDLCALAREGAQKDCVHGTGHLLTVRYPNDIDRGLEICIETFDVDREMATCTGGVSMEYSLNFLDQQKPGQYPVLRTMGPDGPVFVSLTDEEIADPCVYMRSRVDEVLTHECYANIAPLWIGADPNYPDPAEYQQRCVALIGYGTTPCLVSVGAWLIDIVALIDEADETVVRDEVLRICDHGDLELTELCIEGAVNRAGAPRYQDEISGWCAAYPEAFRPACEIGLARADISQNRNSGGESTTR